MQDGREPAFLGGFQPRDCFHLFLTASPTLTAAENPVSLLPAHSPGWWAESLDSVSDALRHGDKHLSPEAVFGNSGTEVLCARQRRCWRGEVASCLTQRRGVNYSDYINFFTLWHSLSAWWERPWPKWPPRKRCVRSTLLVGHSSPSPHRHHLPPTSVLLMHSIIYEKSLGVSSSAFLILIAFCLACRGPWPRSQYGSKLIYQTQIPWKFPFWHSLF